MTGETKLVANLFAAAEVGDRHTVAQMYNYLTADERKAFKAALDHILAVISQQPARNVERELTITVLEHGWATYKLPVSLDFDTSQEFAVEDAFVNADEDELVYVEGAVEHREVTVDNDELVGDRSPEGDTSL